MESFDIPIVGVGVASWRGFDWRSLHEDARSEDAGLSAELGRLGIAARARELPRLLEPRSLAERRARPLMSRSAVLAELAVCEALEASRFGEDLADVGCFMGVGASGGAPEQLSQLLAASDEDGAFSVGRFGDAGLRACNPLYAFQLMNNFTLCHASILHGLGGPNGAFFSRGGGTVAALLEAAWSVRERGCSRALVGSSDSAIHPVTYAEILSLGHREVLGEGAAVLALAGGGAYSPIAVLERCAHLTASGTTLEARLDCVLEALRGVQIDAVVTSGAEEAHGSLAQLARSLVSESQVRDAYATFGEALAAGPALAWTQGLAMLAEGLAARTLVLTVGLDGDLGAVTFRRAT
jgi:hypothetical protein